MELFFGTTDNYIYSSEMTDDKVLSLLGKWRGEKVLKMKTEPGRALSFCAGMTLKEAFLKNGVDILKVDPKISKEEKPTIDELSFNLSHSGKVALVAVSGDNSPIGCDVQIVQDKPCEKNLKIAKRFFSVTEHQILQDLLQQNEAAFKLLFYLIFSAKEAYVKLTGDGLKKGLDSFEIPLEKLTGAVLSGDEDLKVETAGEIEGEKVRFTFLLPGFVREKIATDDEASKYVAVICENLQ